MTQAPLPQPAPHWCSHPQFLRDTLAVVSDNTWICQLSQEMCKQLPSYNGAPQEKVPETSQLGSGGLRTVPVLSNCAFSISSFLPVPLSHDSGSPGQPGKSKWD